MAAAEQLVDKPSQSMYEAQTNHTIELAKISVEYAALYDKYENLIRDAERKEREAESQRRSAAAMKNQLDSLVTKLAKHIGAVSR